MSQSRRVLDACIDIKYKHCMLVIESYILRHHQLQHWKECSATYIYTCVIYRHLCKNKIKQLAVDTCLKLSRVLQLKNLTRSSPTQHENLVSKALAYICMETYITIAMGLRAKCIARARLLCHTLFRHLQYLERVCRYARDLSLSTPIFSHPNHLTSQSFV